MNREIHRDNIHVEFIPPKSWHDRAKWKLLRSYTSANGEVVVPEGFITDGASILWILRWRFSPTGEYFGAAIVHDYIISSEQNWKRANNEFDNEMQALRVTWLDRKIMVAAVKIWAWLKFNLLGMNPKK